jgi:hypothetical protein
MGYDSKGILVFNLKYEHAISFINILKKILDDFINNITGGIIDFFQLPITEVSSAILI